MKWIVRQTIILIIQFVQQKEAKKKKNRQQIGTGTQNYKQKKQQIDR